MRFGLLYSLEFGNRLDAVSRSLFEGRHGSRLDDVLDRYVFRPRPGEHRHRQQVLLG